MNIQFVAVFYVFFLFKKGQLLMALYGSAMYVGKKKYVDMVVFFRVEMSYLNQSQIHTKVLQECFVK